MYSGIEAVMQACVVGSIKISVESVAESMISKYNIHNSKIRMESLYLHFKDNHNGIHFYTANIFRSHGITVENILSAKSCLPLCK